MLNKIISTSSLILIIVMLSTAVVSAQDGISVNTSVDLYNRYIWRGLDIANTPSAQPSLSVSGYGFELGTWGAYTLSNEASGSDEIDFWLSYTYPLSNGISLTALATDYYFPNAGIKFFNFNNHDAVVDDTIPDPGAHTVEIGLSIVGPGSFPITFSGYINVYNEAGNNTYFQLDYPFSVNETELGVFCGLTTGSEDNPDYYGTDELALINLGVSAVRNINISDSFSLPLTVSFILNPKAEISYFIAGISF
jgi:hypothetical protein